MTDRYVMAEGRALHESSGLWHYVRAYGKDETDAALNLTTAAVVKHWKLDTASMRFSASERGKW